MNMFRCVCLSSAFVSLSDRGSSVSIRVYLDFSFCEFVWAHVRLRASVYVVCQ